MKALALIYSQRVPGFKEIQIKFDLNQKRNPNPERKAKMRLSVNRPVDRPMTMVDRAVDRARTDSSLLSVGRPGGRPFYATVDREVDRANPVYVVHTGRPCDRPGANLACFNAPSCSFIFRSLCYLPMSSLSPLSLQFSTSVKIFQI